MPSEIKAKFGTATALTITFAPSGTGIASSTSKVGRQTDLVDNSTNKFQRIHVFYKIKVGSSGLSDNKSLNFYLLKADKTSSANVITDNAGLTDAAHTVVTADPVGGCSTTSSANAVYRGSFVIENPGPMWGISFNHDTGNNISGTEADHGMWYVGENPEAQ